jgi:hypothetical protein
MDCPNCLSTKAAIVEVGFDEGRKYSGCDLCIGIRVSGVCPDVYFNPKDGHIQSDEHIAEKRTGRPIPFWSKRTKLAAMKMAGVRQADSAEKQHGHRNEEHLHWKKKKHFEVKLPSSGGKSESSNSAQ